MFDGFIFGFENFSTGFHKTICKDSLKKAILLKKEYAKDLIISLNSIYTDEEIEKIFSILKDDLLDKIDYIITADLGILEYFKNTKNIKKVIYYPGPLLSNMYDFNILKKDKVYAGVISSEISLLEKLEIINNKKIKTAIIGYGHYPLFFSKRCLIKNFQDQYNLSIDSLDSGYYLIEEKRQEEKYPIIENSLGSVIYSSTIIDLTNEIKKLNKLDIFIFDTFNLLLDDVIKKRREIL